MEKEVLDLLIEGVSYEEVPTIANLEELKKMVEASSLDEAKKVEFIKRISRLIADTLWHSNALNDVMRNLDYGKNP